MKFNFYSRLTIAICVVGIVIFPTLSSMATPMSDEFFENNGFKSGNTTPWYFFPGLNDVVQNIIVYEGVYALGLTSSVSTPYFFTVYRGWWSNYLS